jgi:capsular exopolysaccharide synthesis family protein
MSVLFNALDKLDEKKDPSTMPWKNMVGSGQFLVDLPSEMWNDFYDLREYIRIANMRGMMRLLSITSSVSGEGSSTVAAYLAMLMAGANKKAKETATRLAKSAKNEPAAKEAAADKLFEEDFRAFVHEAVNDKKKNGESAPAQPAENVLLIDGNLHKPTVHEIMGLPLELGLCDILEQSVDWHRCVKAVKGAHLGVITAGKGKLNPAELFGTDSFRFFIKAVKDEYSYVLIDTPAVLNYVDSMSIAAVVDGVVLVVRAGQTRWEVAQDAKRKLITAHANLLGVALNRRK